MQSSVELPYNNTIRVQASRQEEPKGRSGIGRKGVRVSFQLGCNSGPENDSKKSAEAVDLVPHHFGIGSLIAYTSWWIGWSNLMYSSASRLIWFSSDTVPKKTMYPCPQFETGHVNFIAVRPSSTHRSASGLHWESAASFLIAIAMNRRVLQNCQNHRDPTPLSQCSRTLITDSPHTLKPKI
jgi:hypothetical protein